MNVVLGSAFRNNAGPYLARYFRQVDALHTALRKLKCSLRLVLVEGDSTDDTRKELCYFAQAMGLAYNIVTRNHGGPVYASTEEPERMRALSYVGNGILESVVEEDDVLMYVESDLMWDAEAMVQLLVDSTHFDGDGYRVVAPLIMLDDGRFYDIWGFRKNGDRFAPFHPYHGQLNLRGLTQIDSAGSCLVMSGHIARTCRIPEGGALVGFCGEVTKRGWPIFVDARVKVRHP